MKKSLGRVLIIFVAVMSLTFIGCSQESEERNAKLKAQREQIEKDIQSLNVQKDQAQIDLDTLKKMIIENTVDFENLESVQRNEKLKEIREATEKDIRSLATQQNRLLNENSTLENRISTNKFKIDAYYKVYIIKIKVHQSTFTLDLGEHIKNSMNDVEFEIPVDKDYYDNCSIGSDISKSFKGGSLVFNGDFSELHITCVGKRIRKRF